MSNLVRFHNWLINLDDISGSEVKLDDATDKCDLIVIMKSGFRFILNCYSEQQAQDELDTLTLKLNAISVGSYTWNHWLLKKLINTERSMDSLRDQIKKMMNSYKKQNSNKSKSTNDSK